MHAPVNTREQILQYHVKICVCFISPKKGLVHGIFPAGFLRLCDEDDSSDVATWVREILIFFAVIRPKNRLET